MPHRSYCVITGVNHVFEDNMAYDLLPTLRNDAGFTGKVMYLDYGCTAKGLAEIEKYVDHIIPCHLAGRSWVDGYNHRNEIIMECMNETCVDQYLCCDGGDVWFQRDLQPLWDWTMDAIGIVEEVWPCSGEWFSKVLEKFPHKEMRERIAAVCANNIMCNAGVYAGPRHQMLHLHKTWHRMMMESEATQHFGCCQITLNYLALAQTNLHFRVIPRTFNYMPQVFDHTVREGKLYDDRGELVHIGHNAGWNRIVPRMHEGRNLNKRHEGNVV